ncbi:MAG: hypothetical protein IT305_20760 [Chloroflexi bacterium]|nr:hypothetical protein [Chloroflexota bacterium]
MATTRERLHQLLDELPDERLDEAEEAITALSAPFRPLSEAPEDDEPLTDAELAAIAETRAELAHGETIPGDVVRREFGW